MNDDEKSCPVCGNCLDDEQAKIHAKLWRLLNTPVPRPPKPDEADNDVWAPKVKA